MYPKNAASPPEVDLGQILQLSDGAIQTTGASVRVKIGAGAWGTGAGTLSCDTTSGIWTYAPTQAETNAAYFIIGVYKASCTALSKTVVTSISATAGYVGLDWANILSPTTTVNLSGTTVKAVTDRVTANVDQISGDSVAADNAESFFDGTGYAGTGNTIPSVTTVGSVTGAVGSVTTAVTVGTNNDKTGYGLATGAITAAVIATDAIDADAIAASAVTEIQSGLATDIALTTVEGKVDVIDTNVDTLLSRITSTLFSGITYLSRWLGAIAGKTADTTTRAEINATTGGASYNETTDSQEAIRDRGDAAWTTGSGGGGGSTSIMVTPVVAQVPVRVRDTDIETYIGDLSTIRIGIFSGEDAVDLSSFGDLEVCVQAKDGTDLDFVEMADLTIDGTNSNYVSWDPAGPSVDTIRRGKWSLRKSSNKQVIAKGAWIISDAALEDAGS